MHEQKTSGSFVSYKKRSSSILRCFFSAYILTASVSFFEVEAVAQTQGSAETRPSLSLVQGKSLDRSLNQIFQFHSDWRKNREPLSELDRTHIYHRELVSKDVLDQIKDIEAPTEKDEYPDENSRSAKSVTKNDSSFQIQKLSRAITIYRGGSEFPIIMDLNPEAMPGHPDCETDYQCMCQSQYSYNPVPLADASIILPATKKRNIQIEVDVVKNIVNGQFYFCYMQTNHHNGFEKEKRCRFFTKLSVPKNEKFLREFFSGLEIKRLAEADVSELVLESSVRVIGHENWPVDRASAYARPVYAMVNGEEYLFEEILYDPGVRCALTKVFEKPVFRLSGCNDKHTCVKKAVAAMEKALEQEMSAMPISALRDSSETMLPGELFFRRNYERSHVLGSPYYESSQYFIRWYRNSIGRIGPPGMYSYSGGNVDHIGEYIFLRVHQSLSVRAGRNGRYPEASQKEYEVYEQAISQVLAWKIQEGRRV